MDSSSGAVICSPAPALTDARAVQGSLDVHLAGDGSRDSPEGSGWDSGLDPCAESQT